MLIDFHAHIFPDELAPRAIEALKRGMLSARGEVFEERAEGALGSLLSVMANDNVDISVIMPIATSVRNSAGINRFALSARSDAVIAFGSVHPMQENLDETLENLAAAGVPGIKLHPEFQDAYIDSPECVNVLKKCAALGLLVTVHAGEDVGFRPPWKCTPERLARALDLAPGARVIAAHLGGMCLWDDAVKFLAGRDMYFDTAYIQNFMKPDVCRDVIRALGAERVLFGSDFPWSLPRTETLDFIKKARLTGEEMSKISSGNALNLLNKSHKVIKSGASKA